MKNHLIWHQHKWPNKRNNINMLGSRMSFDVMHNLLLKILLKQHHRHVIRHFLLLDLTEERRTRWWWRTSNKRGVFVFRCSFLLHRLEQIFAQRMRLCITVHSKAQAKQINQKSEGFQMSVKLISKVLHSPFQYLASCKFRISIAQVGLNQPETARISLRQK